MDTRCSLRHIRAKGGSSKTAFLQASMVIDAYKRKNPRALFYGYSKQSNVQRFGAKLLFKFRNTEPNQTNFLVDYQVFFTMTTNPNVLSMSEPDISSREDALIDRDSNVFDTVTTVSPVSVSKMNLLNDVESHISFLEAARASFAPYVVETIFPFL